MNKQLAADFKTNSSGSSTGADTECLSSHFALTTEKRAAKKVFSDCLYKFNSFVQLLSLHCGNTNNELKKYDDLVPSNEIGLGAPVTDSKYYLIALLSFFLSLPLTQHIPHLPRLIKIPFYVLQWSSERRERGGECA